MRAFPKKRQRILGSSGPDRSRAFDGFQCEQSAPKGTIWRDVMSLVADILDLRAWGKLDPVAGFMLAAYVAAAGQPRCSAAWAIALLPDDAGEANMRAHTARESASLPVIAKTLLLLLPLLLATPAKAFGYGDPGTGASIYQAAYGVSGRIVLSAEAAVPIPAAHESRRQIVVSMDFMASEDDLKSEIERLRAENEALSWHADACTF